MMKIAKLIKRSKSLKRKIKNSFKPLKNNRQKLKFNKRKFKRILIQFLKEKRISQMIKIFFELNKNN